MVCVCVGPDPVFQAWVDPALGLGHHGPGANLGTNQRLYTINQYFSEPFQV